MTKEYFGECVKAFRFKEIFNYFGWDNDRIVLPPIGVEEKVYQLKSIAQKSGFRVIECLSGNEEPIPTRSIRNRIESLVSQMSHDHIIIYTDSVRQKQVWQFVYRTLSQGTKRVEVEYDIRMNPEKIYERTSGLVFDLDEEGKITIIDVIERVKGSLATNSEKVTKRFYDHFKNQRKSMIDSISGISDTLDREWYASLMLNRLMFCYFIQKRRFLNNDMDYLNHKLQESQKKHVDGFFSFYRNFLLVLFHDGLASRERTSSVIDEIGQVPYLSVDLILTDPPYNLGLFMKNRDTNLKKMRDNFFGDAGWDDLEYDEWVNSMDGFFAEAARVMKKGGSAIVFMSIIKVEGLIQLAEKHGFYYKTTGIWHKLNPMPRNMNLHFINSTEAWVYFTYKTKTGTFNNNGKAIHDFVETSVTPAGERAYGKHPTQKPVQLMEHFILLLSNPGDVVLDPFMGSGSTGVAARRNNNNRTFIGVELNKDYIELATQRIREVDSDESEDN